MALEIKDRLELDEETRETLAPVFEILARRGRRIRKASGRRANRKNGRKAVDERAAIGTRKEDPDRS